MLQQTWRKFLHKGFRPRLLEGMVAHSQSQSGLRRVLGVLDLLTMGVGCIIGAGVFVLTGEVTRNYSGPAIMVSYALAGVAALFSSLSYAEFAADLPVSGSAYNFVDIVFGEFIAWLAASGLVMEYVLSVSTVAKGFSGYFCTLFGMDSDALVITFDGADDVVIDVLGAVMVVLLTGLLSYGVRESFNFNVFATFLTVMTVLFTIAASAPKIETENYTPFFPSELGMVNSFRGASMVFFSYIGFDALATVAEESRNPSRDVPLTIVGSLLICAVLYMLMAAAIVGMVPYDKIDVRAAYSSAFKAAGWNWASHIVSFGALCGIVTSMFSMACAQFRLLMVLSREGFLPAFLSRVNERTATPINAAIFGGSICAALTLFLDISTLSSLVSMGTLFAFSLVCLASIWRRYCSLQQETHVEPIEPKWIFGRLVALVVVSLLEGLAVDNEWPLWFWCCSVVCFFGVVLSFVGLPVVYRSSSFRLPLQPLVSALGVLFCLHLMVTLGKTAYIRFLIWQSCAIVMYFGYILDHREVKNEAVQPLLLEGGQSEEAEAAKPVSSRGQRERLTHD